MIYDRHIFKEIKDIVKQYPIVLVTGSRQVGKSTLMHNFINDGYTYLSFDTSSVYEEAKKSPSDFLNKYQPPLILDEVQKLPELFNEIVCRVNQIRMNNPESNPSGLYILTGSQKYSLMQHVTESMAGRVGIIEMTPVSQAELKDWKPEYFKVDENRLYELSRTRSLSTEELYDSIITGFYPQRWKIKGEKIKAFYATYLTNYIY